MLPGRVKQQDMDPFTVCLGFTASGVTCQPVALHCFGIFSIIMEKVQFLLQQDRWYWPFDALLNIFLVVLCFDLGFRINDFLFQMLV